VNVQTAIVDTGPGTTLTRGARLLSQRMDATGTRYDGVIVLI
jgi:hypothetical protein